MPLPLSEGARKGLLALFGIALGLGLLWAALRNIDFDELRRLVRDIDPRWVIAGIAAYAAGIALRIVRWRSLLAQLVPATYRNVGIILIVGYAVNNILPARLGEFFRADFAKKRLGLDRSAVLGTILVERTFDGLTVVGMLCLGLAGYGAAAVIPGSYGLSAFQLVAASGLALFGIAIAGVIIGAGHAHRVTVLPDWIHRRVQKFAAGLRTLNRASLLRLCLLSALVWLMEMAALAAVLRCIAVTLDPPQLMILTGVTALSTLVPTAPGYVGSYQYVFSLAMTAFGLAAVAGVVAATIVQVALFGGLTLLGITLYLLANLRVAVAVNAPVLDQPAE